MIHVSDMSWTRKINHPTELLQKGQEVEAVVLEVDSANQRISLGLKQAQEDPWTTITSNYQVGQKVKGKVSKIASFGAFVELEGGVDGLVHISQISEEHVEKVKDALKIGQEVEARIVRIDRDERRIGLSLREKNDAEADFPMPEEYKSEQSLKAGQNIVGLASAFDQAFGGEEWTPEAAPADEKKDGDGDKSPPPAVAGRRRRPAFPSARRPDSRAARFLFDASGRWPLRRAGLRGQLRELAVGGLLDADGAGGALPVRDGIRVDADDARQLRLREPARGPHGPDEHRLDEREAADDGVRRGGGLRRLFLRARRRRRQERRELVRREADERRDLLVGHRAGELHRDGPRHRAAALGETLQIGIRPARRRRRLKGDVGLFHSRVTSDE